MVEMKNVYIFCNTIVLFISPIVLQDLLVFIQNVITRLNAITNQNSNQYKETNTLVTETSIEKLRSRN